MWLVDRTPSSFTLIFVLFITANIGCDDPLPSLPDSNVIIGSGNDSGIEDAELPDLGFLDAGRPDAEPFDASHLDGGDRDAQIPDSNVPDGGPSDGGVQCAPPAVEIVSVAEARAREEELRGQVITIIGTTTITGLACTLNPCSKGNPCCNTCTATVSFVGGLKMATSPCFAGAGCIGSECALVCQPPVLGVEGQYRGVLREGPVLELLSIDL